MRALVIFTIIGIILLFPGCLAPGGEGKPAAENVTGQKNATLPAQPIQAQQPGLSEAELANFTARAYAIKTPTFAYDGSNLVAKGSSGGNGTYVFTFAYNSSHSGFGDRSPYSLANLQTPHTLAVSVRGGNVTSAMLDGVYDERSAEWIDIAKSADLAPADKDRSIRAAIDYVRASERYRQNAHEPAGNLSPSATSQLSESAYAVSFWYQTKTWVRQFSSIPDSGYYEYGYMSVIVNNYVASEVNDTLARKYYDPTTDYSELVKDIPDPICPPGQKTAIRLSGKFCYPPSATDGMPCSKSEDCDKGACMRASMGEFGPAARCNDYPFGCRYWLFSGSNPKKVCLD